ncbi:MAG: prepilin-type N-terminal cleavage/methylation domain-containing protein [Candidatus Peregrinibacteria bacterium]
MKTKNHQKGFSLIEVLVTIVFLTVIVFGVIKLETGNITLGNTQNRSAQAYVWANHGLSIVETIGKTGITCATGPCNLKISAAEPYTLGAADEGLLDEMFTRTIRIDPIGFEGGAIVLNPASPNAFRATAQVSWEDSTGLHTVKAKRIIYE